MLPVFHLDYWSCLLTILSTFLVGKKLWYGLVVAAVNCVLVCVIGFQTGQYGFIPANIFCIVVYVLSVQSWRKADSGLMRSSGAVPVPASMDTRTDRPYLVFKRPAADGCSSLGPELRSAK